MSGRGNIICSDDFARRKGIQKGADVAACVVGSGEDPEVEEKLGPTLGRLATEAYEKAGIGPESMTLRLTDLTVSPMCAWYSFPSFFIWTVPAPEDCPLNGMSTVTMHDSSSGDVVLISANGCSRALSGGMGSWDEA